MAGYLRKQGHFTAGMHKENNQLLLFVLQGLFQRLLLQPVSFPHQPLDPVAVDCLFKQLSRYHKSCLQGLFPFRSKQIINFEGKVIE